MRKSSYQYKTDQPVSLIQAILRHKSPNTTAIYLRSLGLGETCGALEELAARFSGKAGNFSVNAVPERVESRVKAAKEPETVGQIPQNSDESMIFDSTSKKSCGKSETVIVKREIVLVLSAAGIFRDLAGYSGTESVYSCGLAGSCKEKSAHGLERACAG